MLKTPGQLDAMLSGRNTQSLAVCLDDCPPIQALPGSKKNDAYGMRAIDAQQIDNSGSHASHIIAGNPELRKPVQSLEEAKKILSPVHIEISQQKSRLNAELPDNLQVITATAKVDKQQEGLAIDDRQLSGAIDYSKLSGYSLRWSELMDTLIQLLIQIKAQDDKRKSEFMQLQTIATERSAEKTKAAGKNVLTGAIGGAAINVAWTSGAVASSGLKTKTHTKSAGKNLNNQQDIQNRSSQSSNAANNPGLKKNKTKKETKEKEKHHKSAENINDNKNEIENISNKHYTERQNYDNGLRKIYAVTSFGASFEKIANAAGDMQASSNRAQSAIADNERSVHQKSSENNADMEGKTYKAAQALSDLLLQLLTNTANTNNAIINRSN